MKCASFTLDTVPGKFARSPGWKERAFAFLLAGAMASTTFASGPFQLVPVFFDTPHDLRDLLAGEIHPESRNPKEALLAYLQLTNKIQPAHAGLFAAYELARNTPREYISTTDWAERLGLLGIPGADFSQGLVLSDVLEGETATLESSIYFDNCQDDAIRTALNTLEARLIAYGRSSAAFTRWVDAQQKVFANCGSAQLALPEEADVNWGALEKQDRAYQIAASYFYNRQYLEAARRFKEIGEDNTSPWAGLGRYLVGRALIREATINRNNTEANLQEAAAYLRSLAQDSDYVAAFPFVHEQENYALAQLDIDSYRNELAGKIINNPAIAQAEDLFEYIFQLRGITNWNMAVIEDQDLALWLRMALSSTPADPEISYNKWRETKAHHWLFMAMERTRTGQSGFAELLAESADVAQTAPGFEVMFIRRLELLLLNKEFAEVKTLAAAHLAKTGAALPIYQRNQIQQMVAKASASVAEFITNAQLQAVGLDSDGTMIATEQISGAGSMLGTRLLSDESVDLINEFFSPSMLLEAVNVQELDPYLKGRLAIAGWTKALLLEDETRAGQFAEVIAREVPALAEEMQSYLSGGDRKFAAASIIFTHPAFSPLVKRGLARHEVEYENNGEKIVPQPDHIALSLRNDNWWCGGNSYLYQYDGASWVQYSAAVMANMPLFNQMSVAEKTELSELREQMAYTAAQFFGPVVLDFARKHPEDSRIPKALHRVVFATHYSCMSGPGEISKAAFALLHERYPDSEWTKQTPYWFE